MGNQGQYTISLVKIGLILFSLDLVLVGLHLSLSNHPYFGSLFDLGQEANLPTWYSSFKLAMTALAAYFCFQYEKFSPNKTNDFSARLWLIVAMLMLLMSIDETAQIHESAARWFMDSLPGARLRMALQVGVAGGSLLWGLIFAPLLILIAGGLLSFYVHRFHTRTTYLWMAGLAILLFFLSFILEQNQAEIAGQYGQMDSGQFKQYIWMSLFEEICELFAINFLLLIHLAYLQNYPVNTAEK